MLIPIIFLFYLSAVVIWTHSTLGLQWDWLDSRCYNIRSGHYVEGALHSTFVRRRARSIRLGRGGGNSAAHCRASAGSRRRRVFRPASLSVYRVSRRNWLLHLILSQSIGRYFWHPFAPSKTNISWNVCLRQRSFAMKSLGTIVSRVSSKFEFQVWYLN